MKKKKKGTGTGTGAGSGVGVGVGVGVGEGGNATFLTLVRSPSKVLLSGRTDLCKSLMLQPHRPYTLGIHLDDEP